AHALRAGDEDGLAAEVHDPGMSVRVVIVIARPGSCDHSGARDAADCRAGGECCTPPGAAVASLTGATMASVRATNRNLTVRARRRAATPLVGGEQNGDDLLAIHDGDVATVFALEALALVDHFHFLNLSARQRPELAPRKGAVLAPWCHFPRRLDSSTLTY